MTTRLRKAIECLPPDKLESLTDYAEFLAKDSTGKTASPQSRFLELGWVGKGADAYPQHESGVDAAHAAAEMRRDAIERSLP
jgi:hypothetical protein